MAKKGGSRGKTTKSKTGGGTPSQRKSTKQHATSVLLLLAAILFFFLVILPMGSFWGVLHNLLLGIFGITAYIVPFIMGYIAILIALDKPMMSISAKIWQSVLLIVMLSSTIHVFFFNADRNFFTMIKDSFLAGKLNKGGGVIGTLLGYPLEYLLTDVGSKIVVILLSIAFFMLVTSTSIVTIAKLIISPAKRAKESIQHAMEESSSRREEREKQRLDDEDKKIDIPLDETEEPEIESEKLKEFAKTVAAIKGEKVEDAPPVPPPHSAIDIPLNGDKKKEDKQPSDGITIEDSAKNEVNLVDELERKKLIHERDDKYNYPPLSLLDEAKMIEETVSEMEERNTAQLLVKTLQDFNISTKIVHISRGPSVTRYELEPSAGVKISRITGLSDDIALRLATTGVRIEAPIPNKAAVGIEVPNKERNSVCLRELIGSREFSQHKSKLTVSLGKDISGNVVFADLSAMPHLLIAGTTGSGKSVCTNAMIQSVLYKASPAEVKMLLIDPKQVEFGVYNDIPHLLVPVVTDPRKAAGALGWAVTEMLQRYKDFAENNVRDIKSFNELASKSETLQPKPLILIVIDELADLMMAAANEVEDAIIRLAQMARAAGMHLVIATQRPSVDVITGLIKANIPSRLALTVASAVDSRTILDGGGAEKLLGRGDMLFMPIGATKPVRIQGCFVSNKEVESVVAYLKNREENSYDEQVIEEINRQAETAGKSGVKQDPGAEPEGETDDLFMDAVGVVVEAGQASTSMIQRRLRVGYARAGRLIDEMEQRGIIGPHEGSKPREVLLSKQQWLEMSLNYTDSAAGGGNEFDE